MRKERVLLIPSEEMTAASPCTSSMKGSKRRSRCALPCQLVKSRLRLRAIASEVAGECARLYRLVMALNAALVVQRNQATLKIDY
jgi:hypothetical protein